MPVIASLNLTITPTYALNTQTVPDNQITVNDSVAQGRHQIVLDFDNTEGLYVRDLGTIFSWPTVEGPILDIWQPSIVLMDDDVYDRISYHFLMTSLGMSGWGHVREMNLPFASSTDLTLLLSFGVGAVPASLTITPIAHSSGLETKLKVTLPPNKFKIIEGFLSSTAPFKFWGNDMELKVKQWGSSGPYQIVKPVSG